MDSEKDPRVSRFKKRRHGQAQAPQEDLWDPHELSSLSPSLQQGVRVLQNVITKGTG